MGAKSHISWTDATFNPWFGCTEVSNGEKGACVGCYARTLVTGRLQLDVWGPGKPRHRSAESTWKKPIQWNRDPAKHLWKGEGNPPASWRPFVFCASLADVFDNEVAPAWRRDLFDLIRATPNLTWLLLTKRPQNIVRMVGGAVPANAAIGCTVVTQADADRDIPVLLEAKAALNPAFAFVSMEPLMERVDLTRVSTMRYRHAEVLNALTGVLTGLIGEFCPIALPPLDWVITGGETDQPPHKARVTPHGAYQALRDQCEVHGTPFLFKQHGEYQTGPVVDAPGFSHNRAIQVNPAYQVATSWGTPAGDGMMAVRVGKRATGWDFLDGVHHDARPVTP